MADTVSHDTSVDNKEAFENIEHAPVSPPHSTAEERRRVIRKLDLHLIPLCFILYTFSVLDRSNLGNAKVAGLSNDIDISGNRYAWLGNMFYIAYIVFQFNNLGWRIFPAHKWATFAVIFWGTVSTLQAVATNWQGLMACRFFLGWAETMFGPGIPLYFSYFYPPEYIGLRFGIFLSGSALANAYGGALAFAISHAHTSVSNWKFLFVIEGVPTVLLAIATWFYLPDSPEKARFLNEREKVVAQTFANNQPGAFEAEGLHLSLLWEAFTDYRNYFFALMNFSVNVSFASLPLFLPTIISELGSFSSLQSNGLSAPPYLLCFFVIIIVAFVSDRLRVRGPFASFFAFVAGIGFIILGTAKSVAARYIGIFLAVNIFVTTSVILVWSSNVNGAGSKRAGGLWIMMTLGQCGPLLGTNMFPPQDAPYYRKGMWVGCAFSMLAAVAAATLSFLLWRDNKVTDAEGEMTEGMSSVEDVASTLPGKGKSKYII